MTDEFDYEKLLDRTMDEIGDGPADLPDGTWLLNGIAVSYKTAEETGQTPKVVFMFIPEAPGDDVDAELLASIGDDWKERQFHSQRIETGSDAAAVRNILKAMGVDLGNTTIKAAMQANKGLIKGKKVWATVSHSKSVKNGQERSFANWSDFQAVQA